MKKTMYLILVSMMAFLMMGATSAEKAYLDATKSVLEWKGAEGKSEFTVDVKLSPELDIKYSGDLKTKSDMESLTTYIELNMKAVQAPEPVPPFPSSIRMYTKGADLYVEKKTMNSFIEVVGGQKLDIPEEFILIKSDVPMDLNKKMMGDLFHYFYTMELGVDTGLQKDGNRFTVSMNADKIVDIADAYIKYTLKNADKLMGLMAMSPKDMVVSEEEKMEALKQYEEFVRPMLPEIKKMFAGSSYMMDTTISEGKASAEEKLVIKAEGVEAVIRTKSASNRADHVNVKLPTSVKAYTAQQLAEMIAPKIPVPTLEAEETAEAEEIPILSVKLDGSYLIPPATEVSGKIRIEKKNGRMFFSVEDLNKLLGEEMEYEKEFIGAAELLEKFGISAIWNNETRTVDFMYQ
ncbi:MAG: hypothetical protein Q4A78_11615 [Peptostreptococcaceae bacterium]|nr:hypothetical protein [Peptostreptococcaceae bacterium]